MSMNVKWADVKEDYARKDAEIAGLKDALEDAKLVANSINDIEFSHQGIGCGLEDSGITDRYEAAEYGFNECLRQLAEAKN